VEVDSFAAGNDDAFEMSVDVKTSGPDGIVYFAQQSDGSDVMAVYLKEGQVNTVQRVTSRPRYHRKHVLSVRRSITS